MRLISLVFGEASGSYLSRRRGSLGTASVNKDETISRARLTLTDDPLWILLTAVCRAVKAALCAVCCVAAFEGLGQEDLT